MIQAYVHNLLSSFKLLWTQCWISPSQLIAVSISTLLLSSSKYVNHFLSLRWALYFSCIPKFCRVKWFPVRGILREEGWKDMKTVLHCDGDRALAGVAQRCCGGSVLGSTQKPPGHGPKQQGGWRRWSPEFLPTSSCLWCCNKGAFSKACVDKAEAASYLLAEKLVPLMLGKLDFRNEKG